jgi:hypothetical protein
VKSKITGAFMSLREKLGDTYETILLLIFSPFLD